MTCPTESALLDFAEGRLEGEGAAAVEAHIDGCEDCRALVAEAARQENTPSTVALGEDLEPASAYTRLGRYLVLELVSAGGMGVVYAAFDPDLERKVALKVLRPAARGAETATEAQSRLLREAQTMARLSHPNVLPVFDVGTVGEQVFLAMELVEGGTLGEWLASARRPWREVVEVFLEAGRGLAAAHSAGLVHRDFKPSNVLIGRDGRVRVTDFGLARSAVAPEPGAMSGASAAPAGGGSSGAGTPAYMAPEQLRGAGVDARSDQFSFCVALWEGLYDERPFAGVTPAEHAAEVLGGRLRAVPASARVPPWVHRVLTRGLKVAPEDRYPFFEGLLEALARSQRGDRLVRWGVGAGAALVLAGIVAAIQLGQPTAGRCAHSGQDVEVAWSGARRDVLERAFAEAGRARDFDALDASLRGWIEEYRGAARRLCAAGDPGRSRCLVARRAEVEALVDVLGRAEPAQRKRAREAVAGLEPATACLQALDAERRWPVPTPEREREVRRVAEAEALLAVGLSAEALDLAGEPGSDAGMEARRLLLRARAGKDGSAAAFEAAAVAGEAAREPALAARAWTGVVSTRSGASPDELRRAALHAQAFFQASGSDPTAQARLALALARALTQAGDHAGASVSLAPAETPAATPLVRAEAAVLRVELLLAAAKPGGVPDVAEPTRLALRLTEETLGTESPRAVAMLFELGRALRRAGAGADARLCLEAARRLSAEAFGDGAVETAAVLAALAELEISVGGPEAAAQHAQAALERLEAALGAQAQELVPVLATLAEAHRVRGRCAEATPLFERALNLQPADPGGLVRVGLAECRLAQGQAMRAVGLLESLDAAAAARPSARFALGRALWEVGKDKERGRGLVEAALAELPRAAHAEAQRWLEAHPARGQR